MMIKNIRCSYGKLSNGFTTIRDNNKFKTGILNKYNELIVDCLYDEIFSYDEVFIVRSGKFTKKDVFKLLNINGEPVIDIEFQCILKYSYGLAAFKISNKWGFIDKKGKVIVEPIYQDAQTFEHGYASVKINGCWGAINTDGDMVVEPIYQHPLFFNYHSFNDLSIARSAACLNDKWGYINVNGEPIIDFKYDRNIYFRRNGLNKPYAIVNVGDKYGVINTKGDYIIEPLYDRINYHRCNSRYIKYNKDYFLAKDKEQYVCISTEGQFLVNLEKI